MAIDAYRLGVSSDWPVDPFIIAQGASAYDRSTNRTVPPVAPAIRTFDGGRTWETLAQAPPASVLSVVGTPMHGRVLFALPGPYDDNQSGQTGGSRQIYRSLDDGSTWTPVLAVGRRDSPQFVPSPAIADDGRLYIVEGGNLFESRDFGQSWGRRTPLDDQAVQALAISPSFAEDATLYAAVTTAGFRMQDGDAGSDPPLSSAGVMVSRDAGLTWTSVADGLQIDGAPYRHVQELAISPAFAQDRTLFAFAWGPLELFDVGAARWKHSALFRSQDAGQTWQVIWQPTYRPRPLPGSYIPSSKLTIRPFPTFGDDGRLVVAVQSGAGNPGSSRCSLKLTIDRGASWRDLDDHAVLSSLSGCLTVVPRPGMPTSLVVGGIENGSHNNAFGVAETAAWRLDPPAQWGANIGAVGPTAARDGSIFLGTTKGIWMLPPTAPGPT
jgi:hypothetical protein